MSWCRVLMLACVLLFSREVLGQEACVRARAVLDKVNSLHIKPRAVNDSLSVDIFSEFFHYLDPESEYFISKDTGTLVPYRYRLDDGNEPVCALISETTKLFRRKAEWHRNFVDSVLSRPLDLTKNELGPDVLQSREPFCSTTAKLKLRVLNRLKTEVLMSMYRRAIADSNKQPTPQVMATLEQSARQKLKKNNLVKVEKLLKDEKHLVKFVHDSYLKAIPSVFDPHSGYFTKDEMASYNEHLNPSAMSFGIKLGESAMGEASVEKVVPGSSAWNSNQVHKGDVLIGIKWRQSGEYVDLVDLEHDVIQQIIDQQGEISAEITLRKTTGEIRNVKLVKEKLENEENIVSGFVLNDKKSKRAIGYINLPGFFTDEDPTARGCAVAVTKEIIKLKGESIEGLILDLRYNGGGSLFEAIELAGLFIDNGPIGVVESRGEAPVSLKDMNRGLIYDGPLVIMVNGGSASASEVVAAALQDYHRAVIAGSTTYGKATGQAFVALNEKDSAFGFLKITELRLYRVNGQTHQMKGVTPDFPITDMSKIYPREEQSAHALRPASTTKKTYFTQWPANATESIKYSIENNPRADAFAEVTALQEMFLGKIPLERKTFFDFMEKIQNSSKKLYEGISGTDRAYSVSNSKFDASVLQVDSYHKEMNEEIMSQVGSSIYIHEAFRLLDNIITKRK